MGSMDSCDAAAISLTCTGLVAPSFSIRSTKIENLFHRASSEAPAIRRTSISVGAWMGILRGGEIKSGAMLLDGARVEQIVPFLQRSLANQGARFSIDILRLTRLRPFGTATNALLEHRPRTHSIRCVDLSLLRWSDPTSSIDSSRNTASDSSSAMNLGGSSSNLSNLYRSVEDQPAADVELFDIAIAVHR
jgi:hypothetical protein